MRLTRVEWIAGAAFLLLVAVALVRVAAPGYKPRSGVSIEGIAIPGELIQTGQTLVRQAEWRPSADVLILGWGYSVGSLAAGQELVLRHGDTVLFHGPSGGEPADNPAFFPADTGYRLQANEPLTLQLSCTNTGPAGKTPDARALIYFVPAAER